MQAKTMLDYYMRQGPVVSEPALKQLAHCYVSGSSYIQKRAHTGLQQDIQWLGKSQHSSGICETSAHLLKGVISFTSGIRDIQLSIDIYMWLHIKTHAGLQAASVPTYNYLLQNLKTMVVSWAFPSSLPATASHPPCNPSTVLFSVLLSSCSLAISLPPLFSPAVLPSLTDSRGHVQSASPLLCSGLLYMPLDIFSFLFTTRTSPLTIQRCSLFCTSMYTQVTIFQYVLQFPPPRFLEPFKITLVAGSQIFNM